MNYTPLERDSIEETFNIGASTASTALSQLTGKRISLGKPSVLIDRAEKCYRLIAQPEDVKTVVQMGLLGDLRGRLFLILDPKQADELADAMLERTNLGHKNDEALRSSATLEVANILFGASLGAIGRFLGLNVTQHVPHMITDMAGAAVDSVFAELGEPESDVLAVSSLLTIDDSSVRLDFLYLFDSAATSIMVEAAKRQLNRHD